MFLFVLLVGSLISLCVFCEKSDGSEERTTTIQISLLQYNLMLWEDTIGKPFQEYKDTERRQRIVDYIKEESDYDIISIEECWSDKMKLLVSESLKDKYPYSVIIETPHYEIGNGLLFLSKFEIKDHYFIKFEKLVGIDRFSEKGYIGLWLDLGVNSTEIRMFHSHTQSGEEHTVARLGNLLQIYEGFQLYHPELPGIVIGDLNIAFTKNNKTEYDDLIRLFPMLEDTFYPEVFEATVDPTQNSLAKKFDGGQLPERDDYILVSKDHWKVRDHGVIRNVKLKDGNDCSDHFPIFSTIELN